MFWKQKNLPPAFTGATPPAATTNAIPTIAQHHHNHWPLCVSSWWLWDYPNWFWHIWLRREPPISVYYLCRTWDSNPSFPSISPAPSFSVAPCSPICALSSSQVLSSSRALFSWRPHFLSLLLFLWRPVSLLRLTPLMPRGFLPSFSSSSFPRALSFPPGPSSFFALSSPHTLPFCRALSFLCDLSLARFHQLFRVSSLSCAPSFPHTIWKLHVHVYDA